MARIHLDLFDRHTQAIDEITDRIEVVIEFFRGFRDLICSIPGISTDVADVVTAETGADMSQFPTAGHLASWAGTCPGSNESAVESSRPRPERQPLPQGCTRNSSHGDRPVQGHLSGPEAQTHHLKTRLVKAVVAIAHTMLTVIWHMAQTGALYDDPGPDFFTRLHLQRTTRRAIDQLRNTGYSLTLSPLENSA